MIDRVQALRSSGENDRCGFLQAWRLASLGLGEWLVLPYLSRLRHLGLIKRAGQTYRYYLTRAGRAVIAAASSITEYAIIPALA